MRWLCLALLCGITWPLMAAAEGDTKTIKPTEGEVRVRLDGADVVALVEVIHVSSLINIAMSLPGMMSVEGHSYQLKVSHYWKGDVPVGVELQVSFQDCVQALQKGERYVILGQLNHQRELIGYRCEDALIEAGADHLIAQLDHLVGPQFARQE